MNKFLEAVTQIITFAFAIVFSVVIAVGFAAVIFGTVVFFPPDQYTPRS